MRISPLKALFCSILVMAGCYFAYRSWDDARFAYLRSVNTAAAHVARPRDSLALSKTIDVRLNREPGVPPTASDVASARGALAETPLSRGLLRILGLAAEGRGDMAKADVALGLSNSLSRRDALTQLWMIERSVGKDDMRAAVLHYHAAMSVHPELRPVLFSILSKAISHAEVRAALRPYIAHGALWSNGMLNAAVVEGDPTDVAALMLSLGPILREQSYEGLNANLMSRLAEKGEFSAAAKLAKVAVPQVDLRSLQTFAVNDATVDKRLGGLSWKLAEDGRLLASPTGTGGLDVEIQPLSRGVVASRMMPVTGGQTYRFSYTVRSGSSAAATAMWQTYCLSPQPKALAWQQTLPKARETQQQTWTIPVPQACKGLEFMLTARGPDSQQSAQMVLEALDLKPNAN